MEEIAQVYARSLFEVATERDQLDDVRDQIGQFADALHDSRELQTFFFSPYFSTEEKKQGLGKAVALGVGGGLGAVGAGVGIGIIFGKVIESVTRQPEMRDEITSIQWLGFALTEAIVFYAFIFGLIAFFLG